MLLHQLSSSFITRATQLSIIAIIIFSLSGCGLTIFSKRDENPVIQDYAFSDKGKLNIFATKASHRMVVISPEGKICAEPPPDVGEAFASAVAGGFRGTAEASNASGQKISGELATQYARAISTQIAPLVYRTQGLQFYRDSIHNLCIARINSWITDAQYEDKKLNYFNQAIELINAELQTMAKNAETFYINAKAGESKINLKELAELLPALQGNAKAPQQETSTPSDNKAAQPKTPSPGSNTTDKTTSNK